MIITILSNIVLSLFLKFYYGKLCNICKNAFLSINSSIFYIVIYIIIIVIIITIR